MGGRGRNCECFRVSRHLYRYLDSELDDIDRIADSRDMIDRVYRVYQYIYPRSTIHYKQVPVHTHPFAISFPPHSSLRQSPAAVWGTCSASQIRREPKYPRLQHRNRDPSHRQSHPLYIQHPSSRSPITSDRHHPGRKQPLRYQRTEISQKNRTQSGNTRH